MRSLCGHLIHCFLGWAHDAEVPFLQDSGQRQITQRTHTAPRCWFWTQRGAASSARAWQRTCHAAGVRTCCRRVAIRPACPVCRLTVRLLTPRGGSVPSARAYHSMVALSSSLLLFGGKDGATLSSQSLAVFDCPKRRWSFPGAVLLQGRHKDMGGCAALRTQRTRNSCQATLQRGQFLLQVNCQANQQVNWQSSAGTSLQRYKARDLARAAAIARRHGGTRCCCSVATAAALSVSMTCTRCATRPVATHGRRTCSRCSAHDLLVSHGRHQWAHV